MSAMASPSPYPEALKHKDAGNEHLKNAKYHLAVEAYSNGIEIEPSSILYSNRAMAYIKLEQYGQAILDADASIALDSSYVKAYYRRGSASYALGKLKQAKKDFKAVAKLKPKDRDARAKLSACEKALKEKAFAEAIVSEETLPLSETLVVENIAIDESYTGPHPGVGNVRIESEDEERMMFEVGNLPREFVLKAVETFKNQVSLYRACLRVVSDTTPTFD